MALTDENGMVMPVSPMYGGNGNNGCGFGGDWAWIILLLLLGWGNNGWGGGFGGNNQLGYDFPWLMTGQNGINANTNEGFQNAMLNDGINGIRSDINGISTQLCNGFAGVEQGANARQMADMQQNFATQTAITGAISNLASQQAECCCEQRLATCQTQNIIQNEGNQTRFADANNTRDLLQNQTANTQAILDKLCQLELDAKSDKINDLERQLTMANLAASQVEQTAQLRASQATTANQLVSELRSCPIPSQPVYGNQPIFTCNNNGCGCGCGNNGFLN